MKTFLDFTRLVCSVLFVILAAVSSLQAQDTDTTKSQPTAEVSVKPDELRASSVTPNEKIKFSPGFGFSKEKTGSPPDVEPPKKDFRFDPKTSFFPKKDEAKSEAEKTDSSPVPLPRNANVNFPRNQTSAPAKQIPVYVRAPAKERFKDYVRNVVGPYSLLGTAVFAGIFQYRDLPPEWENDSKGYARRFASALGILAINETTVYALDEAFKLDSDYYKSTKKTYKGRLQDSIVNTFMARKPDGKRVFGFPRIAGNYSSAIIADTTWYPKRFGVKDGIVDGTYSIGVDVLFNIAREFLFKGK